jgi:hypothetical protein
MTGQPKSLNDEKRFTTLYRVIDFEQELTGFPSAMIAPESGKKWISEFAARDHVGTDA